MSWKYELIAKLSVRNMYVVNLQVQKWVYWFLIMCRKPWNILHLNLNHIYTQNTDVCLQIRTFLRTCAVPNYLRRKISSNVFLWRVRILRDIVSLVCWLLLLVVLWRSIQYSRTDSQLWLVFLRVSIDVCIFIP